MASTLESSLPMRYKVLRRGGNSVVYEVSACIVLKRPTIKGRAQFLKENRIFEMLAEHPPCPELVCSFLHTDGGNFLEYMTQFSLAERLQQHQIRDEKSTQVLKVSCLEPFLLRTRWMSALAKGTAWLESLGYAHGDLRPENVLLNDQFHLKIADFDCTDVIGSEFEACIPPYGRLLGSEAGSDEGSAGKLGSRTEQFALGSIFYFINYGLEVYEDQNFGLDHGPMIVERLQRQIFPKLTKYPKIDSIIYDCWHGRFKSIAELSKAILIQLDLGYEGSRVMSEVTFATKRNHCLQLLGEGILNACPQEKD